MENVNNINSQESTEIGRYLNCDLTYEWYQELTSSEWQGVWEPAAFFETFFEAYAILIARKDNPLLALQKLNDYLSGFSVNAQYYVYFSLEQKLSRDINTVFALSNEKLRICLDLISKELNVFSSSKEETEEKEDQFKWKDVKKHLETLPDAGSKIIHLIDISAEYRQHLITSKEASTGLDELCNIEIDRIKKHEELLAMKAPYQGSVFLSKNKGNKTNLIRIINALYEMRYFHDGNGQIPTKEAVMVAFGKSLGVDLSKYDSDLSQALNTGSLENNIAIFQQMSNVIQEQVLTKNETKI